MSTFTDAIAPLRSQTLFAQLIRMLVLLTITLVVLHNSPQLIELFASQAADSGCHQS